MLGFKDENAEFYEGWFGLRVSRSDFLDAVDALIDRKSIDKKLAKLYANRGRPSIPPLMVFKMLLLQHFNNLSDPGYKETVNNSINFRRFCGIGFGDKVPDETTLLRFRRRLIKCRTLKDWAESSYCTKINKK